MNPEQRFVGHRIQVAVEFLVILFLQVRRFLGPDRTSVVNQVVFICFYLLAVFPFFLFAKGYRYGQEVTILGEQALQARFFQEFLAIFIHVQDDVGSTVATFCFFKGKLRTSIAAPFHSLGTFLIRKSYDVYRLGYHEG